MKRSRKKGKKRKKKRGEKGISNKKKERQNNCKKERGKGKENRGSLAYLGNFRHRHCENNYTKNSSKNYRYKVYK
jgi:hypothetical protein